MWSGEPFRMRLGLQNESLTTPCSTANNGDARRLGAQQQRLRGARPAVAARGEKGLWNSYPRLSTRSLYGRTSRKDHLELR